MIYDFIAHTTDTLQRKMAYDGALAVKEQTATSDTPTLCGTTTSDLAWSRPTRSSVGMLSIVLTVHRTYDLTIDTLMRACHSRACRTAPSSRLVAAVSSAG